jgi:CelD/BcsL family acetyltransferase involved in cellulose biosynthesis
MFDWPGYRDFFLDIANGAQSRRLTHVSRLEVGPAIAAANFGLTFRGRYYYILAGYDDGDLARFGPGTAQLQDLLRYSLDHGIQQFDFTIGDEPYKREWCDVETKLYDQVSPASWRGWLFAGPLVAFRLVKRWVKRNPTLWSAVRKMRTRLGSLRR